MTLNDYLKEVIAEDNSAPPTESKAMAIRRFAEHELDVSDEDVLHDFFDQLYDFLQ